MCAHSASPLLQSRKASLSLLSSSLAVIPLSQTGLLGTLSLSLHFPCLCRVSASSWDDSRYGFGADDGPDVGAVMILTFWRSGDQDQEGNGGEHGGTRLY